VKIPRTHRPTFLLMAATLFAVGAGCGEPSGTSRTIPIGLLLSYSGDLAASGGNSERAVLMVIEAANQAGGIDGRAIEVVARNIPSDPRKADARAQALVDAGAVVVIGPDRSETLSQVQPILQERTVILPSFATFDYIQYKPDSWFVMGPGPLRFACELLSQAAANGFGKAIHIVSNDSYSSALSFVFSNIYYLPKFVLSSSATLETVRSLTRALEGFEAFVLAASPVAASSLIYALVAAGELGDPKRWYLAPTLHTPVFLQSIPRRAMLGAGGVSPGTVAGASAFRARFLTRWEEEPLDDAYSFYDAGAVAVLAIQRALRHEGDIRPGTGLARHLIAVTNPGGQPVGWDEIDRGLELLRQGHEVEYIGVNGSIHFDAAGQSKVAITKWWTIGEEGFVDVPRRTDCE
jgi:ABC-type branched-subunit amino acid transport system substrate-binding protein